MKRKIPFKWRETRGAALPGVLISAAILGVLALMTVGAMRNLIFARRNIDAGLSVTDVESHLRDMILTRTRTFLFPGSPPGTNPCPNNMNQLFHQFNNVRLGAYGRIHSPFNTVSSPHADHVAAAARCRNEVAPADPNTPGDFRFCMNLNPQPPVDQIPRDSFFRQGTQGYAFAEVYIAMRTATNYTSRTDRLSCEALRADRAGVFVVYYTIYWVQQNGARQIAKRRDGTFTAMRLP